MQSYVSLFEAVLACTIAASLMTLLPGERRRQIEVLGILGPVAVLIDLCNNRIACQSTLGCLLSLRAVRLNAICFETTFMSLITMLQMTIESLVHQCS